VRAAETAFPVAIILPCQEVERPIYWTSSRTWSPAWHRLALCATNFTGEIYDGNCEPKAKQNKNSDSFRPTRVRVPRWPILILTGREEREKDEKDGKRREKEKKKKKRTERPI